MKQTSIQQNVIKFRYELNSAGLNNTVSNVSFLQYARFLCLFTTAHLLLSAPSLVTAPISPGTLSKQVPVVRRQSDQHVLRE